MAEKPLRVRLDLSEINVQPYKYVWFPVCSRDLKTIEDFKGALCQKFDLDTEKRVKLFVQDSLLLDEETIMLLRENDTVKILYEDEGMSLKYESVQKSIIKRSNEEHNELRSAKRQKKSHNSTELSSSEHNIAAVDNGSPWTVFYDAHDTLTELLPKNKKKSKKSCKSPVTNLNSSIKHGDRTSEFSQSLNNQEVDNFENSALTMLKENGSATNDSLNSRDIGVTFSDSFLENTYNKSKQENVDKSNQHMNETCNKIPNLVEQVDVIQDSICRKKKFKSHRKTKPTSGDSFDNILSCSSKDQYDKSTILNALYQKNGSATNEGLNSKNINVTFTDINFQESTCNKLKPKSGENADKSNQHMNETHEKNPDLIENVNIIQDSSCRKRKHKRHRKRKSTSHDNYADSILPCPPEDQSSKWVEYIPNSDLRKHIYYTDEFDSCAENENIAALVVTLDSNRDVSKKNVCSKTTAPSEKKNSLSTLNNKNTFAKVSTPAVKSEEKDVGWDVTPIKNYNCHLETSVPNTSKDASNKCSYSSLEPLQCIPSVGTRIAFKVLELTDSYSPEVSKYKEGIVKFVNPNTDEMEIELAEEEIKPGKTGKFENLQFDEVPPNEVIQSMKLSWQQLIEPKIINWQ